MLEKIAALLVAAEHVEGGRAGGKEHRVAGPRQIADKGHRGLERVDRVTRGSAGPVARDGVAHFADEHGVVNALLDEIRHGREVEAFVFAAGDKDNPPALSLQGLRKGVEVGRLGIVDPRDAVELSHEFAAVGGWRVGAGGGQHGAEIEPEAEPGAERGHEVTVVCAAHDRAPGDELRAGVRFVRRGSKLGVYGQARRLLRSGELGPVDVVVDTQNGIPFFAPWATRAPVLVLVHHVHREQWPVVYDPVRSRAGWFLESRIAPWVYRRQRYVAVSGRTREELIELGVDRRRISVVHNGTDTLGPESTFEDLMRQRAPRPTIAVLGRLVPHKRVEHVLKAAASLRASIPDLKVEVIGDGWWADRLVDAASDLGVDDLVTFYGHVDDARKDELLRQAWLLALPSLKEGWGLVVMEAAARGVPAVAYSRAGGVAESIRSDCTGVLVEGEEDEVVDGDRGVDRVKGDHDVADRLAADRDRHGRAVALVRVDAHLRGLGELLLLGGGTVERRERSGHPRTLPVRHREARMVT